MKRILLLAVILSLAQFAFGAEKTPQSYAFQTFAISGATMTFSTSTIPSRTFVNTSVQVACQVSSGAVVFRVDGSSPTLATGGGFSYSSGDVFVIRGYDDVKNFRFVGASGSMGCTYQK